MNVDPLSSAHKAPCFSPDFFTFPKNKAIIFITTGGWIRVILIDQVPGNRL
jgi:hypothetical protein